MNGSQRGAGLLSLLTGSHRLVRLVAAAAAKMLVEVVMAEFLVGLDATSARPAVKLTSSVCAWLMDADFGADRKPRHCLKHIEMPRKKKSVRRNEGEMREC